MSITRHLFINMQLLLLTVILNMASNLFLSPSKSGTGKDAHYSSLVHQADPDSIRFAKVGSFQTLQKIDIKGYHEHILRGIAHRNLQEMHAEASKTLYPKDHWTLKTGYFEDPTPAIQIQTLPLEGQRSLGYKFSGSEKCISKLRFA